MATPGTTGVPSSAKDAGERSRSPGGPSSSSNPGRQQSFFERKRINAGQDRPQQKPHANEDVLPSRPKKRGYHHKQPPVLPGAAREHSPRLTQEDVRRKPCNMLARFNSPSTNSSSSTKATTARGQQKRSACNMEPSVIDEEDVRGLVDKIKSQNTNNGGGRLAKGGPWTAKEDEALRLLVEEKGEGKWSLKAKELNVRMKPAYDALEAKARAKGKTLEAYGRVASQCLHRWKKVLKPGLNKGHWTQQEDNLVRTLVEAAKVEGQPVKWSQVAELLSGRLGKQCRERWFNHLDPTVKKTEWTVGEDEVLFHAQAYFGSRWCEICRFIPGRTENAVKNRFNSAAKNRWLDSTGTVLGGETSKLFIQELLRTVSEDKTKKPQSSVPPAGKSLQSQLNEGGATSSSSATSASSTLGGPPRDASSRTTLVVKKAKRSRQLTTKKQRTDASTAASRSVVYAGLVRENPSGASCDGNLLAVRGWNAPAGTGNFSAAVRRPDDGSTRGVDKRRVVQPERYTDGGWAKHSNADGMGDHHDELVQRDHPPARGKRLGLLQEAKESQNDVDGVSAAAGATAKCLVESASGRRGGAGNTGGTMARGISNKSDRAAALGRSGGRASRGKTRPPANGRSGKEITNRTEGEGSTSASFTHQQQRHPPLWITPSSSYSAASSASSTAQPLQPSFDFDFDFDNDDSYNPSASVGNDRNDHGAAAVIAPSPAQTTTMDGSSENLIRIDNHNSGSFRNGSSGKGVGASMSDFLLDTYNRCSQLDSACSSLEGWGNAANGVGAGAAAGYGKYDESENQGKLPVGSVAEMVESSAMPVEQDGLIRVAAPNLPPLFDSPPLPSPLPTLGAPSPPTNLPPPPSLPSPLPFYYVGGNLQPVAPANGEVLPQHQALAPVDAVFGAQGSGDYGSANNEASNMDVEYENVAIDSGYSDGGNANDFLDMLVDGSEQPVNPSFAAAARDPVAGVPPLMDVEEVCRSFHQEGRLASDGTMSELPIPFRRDSPIGGIPAPTASFWN